MQELMPEDLQWVLSRVPRDLRKFIKEHRIYLAGGAIRSVIAGEKISDYDILGRDKTYLESCAEELCKIRGEGAGGAVKRWQTQNAITILQPPRIPVQFVTRWCFDTADAIVESFDFTITQAVVWFKGKWISMCADRFYSDLAAKRLVYTFPNREEDAGGSMMRVRKFLARGYNIQPFSLAGVISRLMMSVDLSRRADLGEKHLTSILTGLLREVDPLNIVDGLDVVDEHRPLSAEENNGV